MRSEDIQECLEIENGERNWMEPKKLEGTYRKGNPMMFTMAGVLL
jgi:hypothetical protein